MILISGTTKILPGQIDQACALAREVAAATRREAGCLEYGFHRPVDDDSTLHVFERWESDADLAAHLAAPHTRAFLAGMGPLLAAPPNLWRHETAKGEPLKL